MKRLIVFVAVLAIVSTAAFAQVSLGGSVGIRGDVMNGNSANDSDGMYGVGSSWRQEGRLEGSVVTAGGNAGGNLRLWANQPETGVVGAPPLAEFHGWAWWRPNESLRLMVGRNPWGDFGVHNIVGGEFTGTGMQDDLVGWGAAGAYHYGAQQRNDQDGLAEVGLGNGDAENGRLHNGTGFYNGFGDTGISAQITPAAVEGLTVILALPWMNGNDDVIVGNNWPTRLLRTHLSVRYNIQDAGLVNFSWIAGPGHWAWNEDGTPPLGVPNFQTTGAIRSDASKFFLSMYLNQIPALQDAGLKFNIGVAYTVPWTVYDEEENLDMTVNFPLEVGLGAMYNRDQFWLAVRAAAVLGGNVRNDELDIDLGIPMLFGLNIHPRYVMGNFQIAMNAGIQIQAAGTEDNLAGDGVDSAFGWHVTPYVKVSNGSLSVFGGLHFQSNGVGNEPRIDWRVPIGVSVGFW